MASIPRGLLVRLRPANTKAADALLAHADRCWKAEEVNSTRYASQTQMLTVLVVALITLVIGGVARFVNDADSTPIAKLPFDLKLAALAAFTIVVMVVLVWLCSTLTQLHPRPRSDRQLAATAIAEHPSDASPAASDLLAFAEAELDSAGRVLEGEAWAVFRRTYAAYIELARLNRIRAFRLDRARDRIARSVWWLFGGGILYFLVFGLQIVASASKTDWDLVTRLGRLLVEVLGR